jgi:hypothetical protein
VERVSPLENQLRGLNKERREAMRLQRLASWLDIGEYKTLSLLEGVNRREGQNAQKYRKDAKEELEYQIKNTAAMRGYGAAKTAIFGALIRANAALGNWNRGLARVQESLAPVSTMTGRAFAVLTAGVMGFVYAGMRGTVEGNALTLRFQLLSREIAGVFKPVINGIINALDRLRAWLHGSSDGTKQLVMNLVLGAAAGLGIAKVMSGPLFSAISGAILGIQALTAAGIELDVVTGGILLVVGALVVGVAALAVGTETGRTALSALWGAAVKLGGTLQPLIDVVSSVATEIGDMVSEDVLDFLGAFTAGVQGIVSNLMPSMTAAAKAFMGVWQEIYGVFHSLEPLLKSLFGAEITTFGDVIKGAVDMLAVGLKQLADAIHAFRVALVMAQNPGVSLEEAKRSVDLDDQLAARRARLAAQEREKGRNKGDHELTVAGKGFEGIFDTFRRVQNAAVTASYDKQTADNTKKIAENTSPANQPQMPQPVPAVGG